VTKLHNQERNKLIAVIGLGYVGLPLAAAFGKKRTTVGFDINENRVRELSNGVDRTNELSIQQIEGAKYLTFTSKVESIKHAQIYIITVPTPVDDSNRPDFSFLLSASKSVGEVLKPGDIVIYESTVYPGATEEICVPILEKVSGLKYANHDADVGPKFFFCGYSPERINPGDKLHDITSIKKITSGSTVAAANEIDDLYKEIITAGTYKARTIKVAEAAKVIENCQRDINIAFVNELSLIFHRMGINTSEVLAAAGTKWNFLGFKPGLVGGHCIGVDPFYLTYKSEQLGYRPEVILAGRRINDGMASFIAQNIIKKVASLSLSMDKLVVHVMGVTFKENCPDIRNSKVVDLIHELRDYGALVVVSDPVVDIEEARNILQVDVFKAASDVGVKSNVLVVAVAHQQYLSMSCEDYFSLVNNSTKALFVDVKSIMNVSDLVNSGFEVFSL